MFKSAVHTHNIPKNVSQENASITVAITNENNINATVRITQGEKNKEDSDFWSSTSTCGSSGWVPAVSGGIQTAVLKPVGPLINTMRYNQILMPILLFV